MAQYPLVVFPDAVEVIVGSLNDPPAADPGPVVTAYGRIPDPRPSSFAVVRRAGGPRIGILHDSAQIIVDSYGSGEADAQDVAQRNRALLNALPGSTYTASIGTVTIGRVDELSGPTVQPDPLSDQPRYSQQFMVTLRGIEAT